MTNALIFGVIGAGVAVAESSWQAAFKEGELGRIIMCKNGSYDEITRIIG